ncbi:MAG: hypothetical protein KDD34_05405 [Bdellovibrionales bacterium]|nr:hypothetical protein [Bdellovibrionales bacterium]
MKNIATAVQAKASQNSKSLTQKDFQPNHRILVVDDEKDIVQSYIDILDVSKISNVVPMRSSRSTSSAMTTTSDPEFELVVAKSYDEALAIVKRDIKQGKPFAMGFFDVLLGEGPDGFDLVKEIHAIDPHMYAVFVTAYNDRSVDSIQSFLGADKTNRWDYLNKPFSNGEILQKARNFTSLWNLNEEKKIQDSKLQEAQRRLVESEKLSSIAAVARGVSHEFGNLLMQIMGKADICLTENNPEKMKTGLEVILDATQRANEILEKFKDLSNPAQATREKSKIYAHQILDEVLVLMEHQIKTQNVKVSRIKTDKVLVEVNPTSLLQVLVNLTINSIHAMGSSGQIDFSVTDVGDMVEIRVRDYGPGIKEELIDKVIEPFFTTKGKQGTGLGLAICKEIIEVDHRGEFMISNHGVKGVEAILRLPKEAEKE